MKKCRCVISRKEMDNNMAIEKYLMTYSYGFGVMDCSYSPKTEGFTDGVTISVDYKYTKFFPTGMKSITLKRKNINGVIQDTSMPLYIVYENERWKEYFTGTILKEIRKDGSMDHRFNCSTKDRASINAAKKLGVREFTFTLRGNYRYLDPQQFANEISKYNDNEIETMVSQFYDLMEKARHWAPKFEKEVFDFYNECKSKNATSASAIESKMGAYARKGIKRDIGEASKSTVSYDPDTILNVQSEKGDVGGYGNERPRKRTGIIVVLVIVIIILFIMYMTK